MIGGYDVIWGIMKMSIIMAWFIGTGCVAWFILHFKPTRKLIEKYMPFLLTND
jgi:hypothetical protein